VRAAKERVVLKLKVVKLAKEGVESCKCTRWVLGWSSRCRKIVMLAQEKVKLLSQVRSVRHAREKKYRTRKKLWKSLSIKVLSTVML